MSVQSLNNEQELLQRIAEGDEVAFTNIFNHYYPLLYTYIIGITRSKTETENILQDIFLKIWMGREALEFVERFKPYLWVMARHQSINAMRSALRREINIRNYSTIATHQDTNAYDLSGETEFHLTLIDEAVAQLPDHHSRVWMLNRKHKMKQADIAREMGIALPTVKKYMQEAVTAITRYVKERSSLGMAIIACLSAFFEKS